MQPWTLFEVFVRSKHGLSHKHVGSVQAADASMALEHASELYTRRSEGISVWVVASAAICACAPEDKASWFETAEDKAFRHARFYELPDEVGHM